jgi:hypothetical protein
MNTLLRLPQHSTKERRAMKVQANNLHRLLHNSPNSRVCQQWHILVVLVVTTMVAICQQWQEEDPGSSSIITLKWLHLRVFLAATYSKECNHHLCTKEICLNIIWAFLILFLGSLICKEDIQQDGQWKEMIWDTVVVVVVVVLEEEVGETVVVAVVEEVPVVAVVVSTMPTSTARTKLGIKMALRIHLTVHLNNMAAIIVSKKETKLLFTTTVFAIYFNYSKYQCC